MTRTRSRETGRCNISAVSRIPCGIGNRVGVRISIARPPVGVASWARQSPAMCPKVEIVRPYPPNAFPA